MLYKITKQIELDKCGIELDKCGIELDKCGIELDKCGIERRFFTQVMI